MDERRSHQLSFLRETCLPQVCFILHTVLHSTEQFRKARTPPPLDHTLSPLPTLPFLTLPNVVSYPAPKSPRGEGSGDIGTISWLYRRVISCQYYAINHVPVPRCYAMQCTIKELRSHWLALNRQLTLHDRCCATRCKVT